MSNFFRKPPARRATFRPSLERLEVREVPAVVSNFTNGTEGWTTVGDVEYLRHAATGGNPGGQIVVGDRQIGNTWFYQVPAKFRGNHLAEYGKYLTFDLRQSSTDQQFNHHDVILRGAGLTLVVNTPRNPGSTWTSYAVQLDATGGWRKVGSNGRLSLPTHSEFRAALGGITNLQIRGEFSNRKDTGRLDNVVLGGAAPRLVVNDVARREGRQGERTFLDFTVRLSHIVVDTVTVQGGTRDGTAKAGSDYGKVGPGTVTFRPGETTKTVRVTVGGDAVRERDETFALVLWNAVGASLADDRGVGTILNDD